jgi:putative membrane protein
MRLRFKPRPARGIAAISPSRPRNGPAQQRRHAPSAAIEGLGSWAMRRWVITWAFNVVALFVAAWLLSGIDYGDSWWTLFLAAIVFTVVNAFVKPILTVLSIPFIVVTLGLFYFIINVLMLYLTDWLVGDFEIDSFWWGVLAAIIVTIVNWVMHHLFGDPRDEPERHARHEPAY